MSSSVRLMSEGADCSAIIRAADDILIAASGRILVL